MTTISPSHDKPTFSWFVLGLMASVIFASAAILTAIQHHFSKRRITA